MWVHSPLFNPGGCLPQAMLPVHSGPWKAPKMNLAKGGCQVECLQDGGKSLESTSPQKNGLELAVGES